MRKNSMFVLGICTFVFSLAFLYFLMQFNNFMKLYISEIYGRSFGSILSPSYWRGGLFCFFAMLAVALCLVFAAYHMAPKGFRELQVEPEEEEDEDEEEDALRNSHRRTSR